VKKKTVNNYGPPPNPPVALSWSAEKQNGNANSSYEQMVTIRSNVRLSPVSIEILSDSPVEQDFTSLGNKNGLSATNEHLFTDGDSAFVYFEGTPLTPGDELYITLRAKQPFTVLNVETARLKGLND
jgi:hypothetical protein